LGLLIGGAWAEAAGLSTVAPFRQAPVVDGKIEPGEWEGAVGTVGFLTNGSHLLDARRGRSWFGFTPERLYFAVVSELPPDGKLMAEQRNRDADVIWDDGVEIWIDPNRDTRPSGQGDPRYYNFMGNSVGALLDVCYDPTKGTPDPGWNAHWEVANGIDPAAGVWVLELSVPITDLGMAPGTLFGRSVGVLIARNFKRNWNQATWFPHQGAFAGWLEYPRMVLTEDGPTVTIESLGEKVFQGQLELQVRLLNPGLARPVQVQLILTSADMPELRDEKRIDLPAGGAAEYAFAVPAGRLHEEAQHHLTLAVQSPDGQTPYFHYAMKWTKAPENRWPEVFVGPNPEAAVRLAYYPSYRFIRLKIDPAELGPEAEASRSAAVRLLAPDGRELLRRTMRWKEAPAVQEFAVPDLPDGTYRVIVKLDRWQEEFHRTFVRQHFPWEGNTLGITETIYPPFEPITVRKNEVRVVLRTYRVGGLGLWDSVQAAGNVSAGPARELLAGPIVLRVNEGQTLKGRGRFTSVKPQAVLYEGTAQGPGVTVQTRCTTEYDGCMKVEMELRPGRKREAVKALGLEIPLRDSEARLWHCSTAGLRINPAGAVPAGQGDVWDSRRFPDGNWYGNFKPYLWLGGEERGIAWFADNDKGWVLDVDEKDPDRSAPCLVLHRERGVLTLRVNLIQKPILLTQPRTIVFGLMASPAKPMPADWRKITFDSPYADFPNIRWMGSEYWGADTHFAAKYPRNGDLSILEAVQKARLGTPIDADQFVREYAARNFRPELPLADKSPEEILNLVRWTLNWAASAPGPQHRTNAYWEEFHSTNALHEEVRTFQNEWSGSYGYGSTGGLVPSYRDFAVWWGAQFIRRGIGLYFDNAFPKRAYDPVTTSAYVLPNGRIQPSAGMWAHREYLKRIWIVHRSEADPRLPVIQMIHMTNTHLLPYMGWNDANLDLEWFYGPEPQQSKYAPELLRAESLGRQTGNLPLVLANIDNVRSKEEQAFAERTRFGVMMVHEIKARMWGEDGQLLKRVLDFGYGQDDCQVFNYWDEHYPVRTSHDEQVKSLLLRRGQDLLLVLCTWNPKPETVTLRLDGQALGLTLSAATDAETGEALKFDGEGTLAIPLPGYGVRLVRMQGRSQDRPNSSRALR